MIEQDDAKPMYTRLDGEPGNWYDRFLCYRNMGPSRSLLGAINAERVQKGAKPFKGTPSAWLQAYDTWDWKFRAAQYDSKLQAEREERNRILREAEAAEIERIMTTGYAAVHKRIETLSETADLIKQSFREQPASEKIKFEWVTPDKIRELRGCLDDIAKELGHRVSKKELTGKDGGPIEFVTEWGGGILDNTEEEV